jgi:TadE-like protein
MVEFALILLPLLLLVSGIIWFGIGLNFWLDMNRIANQGARWAVVNCGPPAVAGEVCNPSLEGYLEQQTLSAGNNIDAEICYETMTGSPSGTAGVGDPVTVRLTHADFDLVPMLGIDIDLTASASMRLEQVPTLGGLDAVGLCP